MSEYLPYPTMRCAFNKNVTSFITLYQFILNESLFDEYFD
jgi:hypothetical protein